MIYFAYHNLVYIPSCPFSFLLAINPTINYFFAILFFLSLFFLHWQSALRASHRIWKKTLRLFARLQGKLRRKGKLRLRRRCSFCFSQK